jgi:hypothetical protein
MPVVSVFTTKRLRGTSIWYDTRAGSLAAGRWSAANTVNATSSAERAVTAYPSRRARSAA